MWQQIIALALIIIFISNLFKQKNKKEIGSNEFNLWLIFWFLGALAILFIKELDKLVQQLGFSGAGINFLLYLAIIILFYFIFKLRLKIAKMDKEITKIVKEIALKK
jgi:small membrane protein